MSQPRRPAVAFPGKPSKPDELRPFSHNLPAQATPLIGREREIRAACELLRHRDVRVLTLTGPPGIGKTRLGIEISLDLARDFSDGVFFVPLAPITESGLVLPAVAQALGIKETPGLPLSNTLTAYLSSRRTLLVLDNFEQVIEAATEVADLLARCSGLKVMVTSREVLRIYGEHDYPVPPLSLPADPDKRPDLETLKRSDAVELFLQRARAVTPAFELTNSNAHIIAGICLRLDGLPLAIELAAARTLVLPPEEILARLKSRLKLLTGGARNLPERQRTLQAAIDWSYNLLDPGEQTLFRRIGVFVGGCTLEAIEQVCGTDLGTDSLDGVTSLVSKSLLQRQEGALEEPRFMMLETIREYAREKLKEHDELDSVSERHRDYFLQFAETAERGTMGSEMALWIGRLDAELNNLRAALEWSLSREDRAEQGLRLAGALRGYWDTKGYFIEGRQWCVQLLGKTEAARTGVERVKALNALARMTWQLGHTAEARSIYERSLETARALGRDEDTAGALQRLGSVAMWQGEYDFSHALYEESLAIGRRLASKEITADALSMIGVILMRRREYLAAQGPLDEALAINRELGNAANLATALAQRGSVAIHLGEYEKAKSLIEESIGRARELGADWVIALCLARLSMIALLQGDTQQALSMLVEGLERARVSGIRRWSRWYLVGLAELARQRGMAMHAAELIGASEGELSMAGAHYEPATHDEIERIIAGVRAEMDEESFERLRARGRTISLEEALAYASALDSEVAPESGQPDAPAGSGAGSPESHTTRTHGPTSLDDLTEREVQVLRLIAQGKSNQEIASELVLSPRTAERHISNIYLKIGATGKVARATAAAYALRHGLAT